MALTMSLGAHLTHAQSAKWTCALTGQISAAGRAGIHGKGISSGITRCMQDAKRDMRSALSRSALLGELRVKKVIELVPEEVRQIHGLLEADFNPLQLCKQLAPLIEKLSSLDAPLSAASPVQEAPLAQYQQALRQVGPPCFSAQYFICSSATIGRFIF